MPPREGKFIPEGLFYFMAFCTGASGLMYEILWNRSLLLMLGSTTYAAAGVLTAFIGGLAIGAFLITRVVARIRRPLLVYAALKGFIASYALGYSYFMYVLNGHLSPLDRFFSAGYPIEVLLYGSLVFPTMAMGASLPLLVLARQEVAGESGRAPGRFYGWDTLGAALGAVLTGFLLIPRTGVEISVFAAASLTILAAVIALLIHAHRKIVTSPPVYSSMMSAQSRSHPSAIVILAMVISGAASMGYEVVWTRILVLIIGSSTYAFTLVVAVFVFGTAMGSFFMSRRIPKLRSPTEVLVHTQIGIAALGLMTVYLYGQMPILYVDLTNSVDSPIALFSIHAFLASLLMLPPVLLIGASFPLFIRVLDPENTAQHRSFGRVYGWLSVGNVLGIVAPTFLLIPWLGLQRSTLALAFFSLLSATSLLISSPTLRGRKLLFAAIPALAAFAIIAAPRWDPVLMTSGVYAKLPVYRKLTGSDEYFENLLKLHRIKYYKESIENVVSVVEMPSFTDRPYYALAIDGKVDASTGAIDMATQVLSGHLPFILGRNPKDVLVIGLASGVTLGAVGLHPVHTMTAVEIEPAMKEAARFFSSFNHNILENPRTTIVIDDGRHYLRTTEHQYDLIISEPSNPWMSGPSRLFTREFFALAKKRLREDGMLAQWVPLYGMGEDYYRSILHTFLEQFAYAATFRVSDADLLCIGSNQPIKISPAQAHALFDDPVVRNDLQGLGINSPGSLLARWIGGRKGLYNIASQAQLNTDDNGYVEFGSPLYLYQNVLNLDRALLEAKNLSGELSEYLEWDKASDQAKYLLLDVAEQAVQQKRDGLLHTVIEMVESRGNGVEAMYLRGRKAESSGQWEIAAKSYENVVRKDPSFIVACDRLLRVSITLNKPARAGFLLNGPLRQAQGTDYEYWRGLLTLQKNEPRKALLHFTRIDASRSSQPEVFLNLYGFLAARRCKDVSSTKLFTNRLVQSLRLLRGNAEMDRDREIIEAMLEQVIGRGPALLTEDEQQALQNLVAEELLHPLSLYDKGVSSLLAGRLQEASEVFEQLIALVSNKGGITRALYLLDVIQKATPI